MAAGVAAASLGCAPRLAPPPSPAVAAAAAAAETYSARLRVSVRAPGLRGRTPLLVGFRRPDALRVEIPGPGGPRLLAVARGDRLWAVFPAARAFFEGAADAESLGALLGVALTPAEVMDLLVGIPSPRVVSYRAGWGRIAPVRIVAELDDGTRLTADVEDPEPGVPLRDEAFGEPPHPGFRRVDADEARTLWSR